MERVTLAPGPSGVARAGAVAVTRHTRVAARALACNQPETLPRSCRRSVRSWAPFYQRSERLPWGPPLGIGSRPGSARCATKLLRRAGSQKMLSPDGNRLLGSQTERLSDDREGRDPRGDCRCAHRSVRPTCCAGEAVRGRRGSFCSGGGPSCDHQFSGHTNGGGCQGLRSKAHAACSRTGSGDPLGCVRQRSR